MAAESGQAEPPAAPFSGRVRAGAMVDCDEMPVPSDHPGAGSRLRPSGRPQPAHRRLDPPPRRSDAPNAGQSPVEEAERRRIVLAGIAQPVQQRGAIHRGEDRPLGVPTEIRRTIARRMPDRIHRARGACRGQPRMPGSASSARARRIASLCGRFCSSRSAITARTRWCSRIAGSRAAAPSSIRRSAQSQNASIMSARAAGKQLLRILRRHADIGQSRAQRAARPAIERHMRQHRGDGGIAFGAALDRHQRPSCCAAAARASSSVKPNSEKSCIRIGYRMPSRWSYSCCTTPAWKPVTSRATGLPSQSTPR